MDQPSMSALINIQDAAVLDAFPIGVMVVNERGLIVQANRQLAEMFGYSTEALLDQPVELLVPKDIAKTHVQDRKRFQDAPNKRAMGMGADLYAQRKDGTNFPVQIGLNPVDTPDGQRIIATVSDISERKRLEQATQQVIESAPCGMIKVSLDGKLTLVNRHLANLFGYTEEELIGQPLDILLPHRMRGKHHALFTSYVDNPSDRPMGPGRDLTGMHKRGTEFPVEIGLSSTGVGEDMEILATVVDISERKRMENGLRQANESLDEFTYVASHDLRSPLRGIANLVEWVEDDLEGNLPDEVAHNIERIKLRISAMERLIEDLLLYARAGYSNVEFVNIHLPELFDEIIELHPSADTFVINYTCDVEDIIAPKAPLETVLRNLISNAIKHHDQTSGQVNITVKASGSYVLIGVEDDGPGIPLEAQDRVFKLFQSLSPKEKSSGIGLAVSKRLVNSQGGVIRVVPKTGRGTKFQFSWPRVNRSDLDD